MGNWGTPLILRRVYDKTLGRDESLHLLETGTPRPGRRSPPTPPRTISSPLTGEDEDEGVANPILNLLESPLLLRRIFDLGGIVSGRVETRPYGTHQTQAGGILRLFQDTLPQNQLNY